MQCIDVYRNKIEVEIEMSDEVSRPYSPCNIRTIGYFFIMLKEQPGRSVILVAAWIFRIIYINCSIQMMDASPISRFSVCLVKNCGLKYTQLQSGFEQPIFKENAFYRGDRFACANFTLAAFTTSKSLTILWYTCKSCE